MSNFSVGDKVNYHSVIGEPATSIEHTIEKIGTIPSSRDNVAWISGKSGCVSLEALSLSEGHSKIICKVKGFLGPGAICGAVKVGDFGHCGAEPGTCPHQIQ